MAGICAKAMRAVPKFSVILVKCNSGRTNVYFQEEEKFNWKTCHF